MRVIRSPRYAQCRTFDGLQQRQSSLSSPPNTSSSRYSRSCLGWNRTATACFVNSIWSLGRLPSTLLFSPRAQFIQANTLPSPLLLNISVVCSNLCELQSLHVMFPGALTNSDKARSASPISIPTAHTSSILSD